MGSYWNARRNENKVIDCFLKAGDELTRFEVVARTGMARTTTHDTLQRLIMDGFIFARSEDRKVRGRPKVFYYLTSMEYKPTLE